jgi:hypothetical protein
LQDEIEEGGYCWVLHEIEEDVIVEFNKYLRFVGVGCI